MPPSNPRRRDELTDAAIEIVVRGGLHGLSHRAVDEAASVPRGTTSNYFRSRDTLLEGTVRRVIELHFSMMAEKRARYARTLNRQGLIEFLSEVVDEAVNRFPGRYLAMIELALESTRRPEFRQAFVRVSDEAMKLVVDVHRSEDEPPSREDVELLNVFYNGALFTSLVMPQMLGTRTPKEITRDLLEKLLNSYR